MRRPGLARRVALRLALLGASSLMVLLLLEGAVRLLAPANLDFYDWRRIKRRSPQPGQSYEYIPGSRSPGYVGVPVRINRLGLRDAEVVIPKPRGLLRILALGDSVTFGYGVRAEEAYPEVLEGILAARLGRPVEVVNGGVEGTGLDYDYHFLRRRGRALAPDLVLLGLVLNDIRVYDPSHERPGIVDDDDEGFPRRVNAVLLRHSHLWLKAYLSLKSLLFRFGVADFNAIHQYDVLPLQREGPELRRAWASSAAQIQRLARLARELRVPLHVVVFPTEVQLGEGALALYQRVLRLHVSRDVALGGVPQRRIAAIAREAALPLVDLLPAFRAAAGRGGPLFLRNRSISHDPVHPSARGHRIAAEAIARHLAVAWAPLAPRPAARPPAARSPGGDPPAGSQRESSTSTTSGGANNRTGR